MAVLKSSKLGNPQAAFLIVWIFELIEVERAFRTLKTVDLKVRLIPHRLSDWMRAHILLSTMQTCVSRGLPPHCCTVWAQLIRKLIRFPLRVRLEYQQGKAAPLGFDAWQERTD